MTNKLLTSGWFIGTVIIGIILCTLATGAVIQENVHLKEELKNKTALIKAHNDVLDRIYADHPSYVDDVLSETDEYCNLTEREIREKRVWKGK